VARLERARASRPTVHPGAAGTQVGSLIARAASGATRGAHASRAVPSTAARALAQRWPDARHAESALVELPALTSAGREDTFARFLCVLRGRDFAEGPGPHHAVPHGLRSVMVTNDLREAESFAAGGGPGR